MPVIKKHFSLSPLNDNPAQINDAGAPVITNGLSHKDGFPTIRFSIPPQPAMLEIKSLKLVGQILVKKADNTLFTPNPSGTLANHRTLSNGREGGEISFSNAVAGGAVEVLAAETALNIPNWGGVKNMVDKVIIQSKKSLIELTSAINYGGFVSISECYTNNKVDYLNAPLCRGLASGPNADLVNRRMLGAAKAGTGGTFGFGSLSSSNDREVGQHFSIPIQVDLLNIQDLFLDDSYLGGLLITLHLTPDAQLFSNRFGANDTANQPNADQSGVNYVLKNIKLEGRYILPTPQEISAYPKVLPLNSRLNLINDIQSSINSNSYTPQLQMVKSMVNVFLDNQQTNSFSANMNNFRLVPGLKGIQVAKNGLRFPQNYKVELKPNALDTVVVNANGGGTSWVPASLQFIRAAYNDCEVRKYFDRAVLGGSEPYHSSATMKVSNDSLVEDYHDLTAAPPAAGVGQRNNCKADCVGVGTDFTLGVGIIQNFVNQDYNLTLESGVNTGKVAAGTNRNGVTTANPLLQQSFVQHQGQFDSVNLVKVI